MDIESIDHKELRRFYLTGNTKGLIEAGRLGRMLAFITAATSFDVLATPPNYGLHPLTGDRAGQWAMTVTKNWRLVFTKVDEATISALDLEDYH